MEQKYIIKNCKSFKVRDILECGQCFRWKKESDGSYTGVIKAGVMNVSSNGEKDICFTYELTGDANQIIENYFDMKRDYKKIKDIISIEDKNMIEAFCKNEDIHAQAASKVFNIPLEEVTKEERTKAKAVNFGIVYGISEFGLGEQLGVSRKKAKEYIEQYLDKYNGIKEFMTNIVEETKEKGYVETLYHRRRYVPELKSNNYMMRQFGQRVAMNTPIQGTAADIMKIAMINVLKELKQRKMKSKIVLQVHDEMMIEAPLEEVDEELLSVSSASTCEGKSSALLVVTTSKNPCIEEMRLSFLALVVSIAPERISSMLFN